MSEIKARYVGHPDGVDLSIPYKDGDVIHLHVAHGSELPTEYEGRKIPASYRDSLLEQTDNWTEVKRDSDKAKNEKGDA